MQDQLIDKVMDEIKKRMASQEAAPVEQATTEANAFANPGMTEFVGTAIGDTIGIVIANVDPMLHDIMKIDPKFHSIGILGGRTGAGPHIMAADEAVKATNTEIISIELARDTKGGAGHGCLILFGAEEVSDARRAIEVALKDLDRTMGDVYGNDAGHIELQYSARASYAVNKAFNGPIGKAFGLVVGAPAAIGVLMADVAVKTANVELVGYASPGNGGTSFSNEVIIMITGDSGAVRQAVLSAKDAGKKLLEALGGPAASTTTPYI
jgi:microcompartment protein PduB